MGWRQRVSVGCVTGYKREGNGCNDEDGGEGGCIDNAKRWMWSKRDRENAS